MPLCGKRRQPAVMKSACCKGEGSCPTRFCSRRRTFFPRGKGPLARPPFFVELAAAAVVVGQAGAAAAAAATAAAVAAPAEQEEDDEDDPPGVVATAHETIVAIAVHKEYLQEVFSAALPLIPWYSGGPNVCVAQENKASTLSNRYPISSHLVSSSSRMAALVLEVLCKSTTAPL